MSCWEKNNARREGVRPSDRQTEKPVVSRRRRRSLHPFHAEAKATLIRTRDGAVSPFAKKEAEYSGADNHVRVGEGFVEKNLRSDGNLRARASRIYWTPRSCGGD